MFNKDDKGVVGTAKKLAEKVIKTKKMLVILGSLLPLFKILLIVIIVVMIMLLPIMFFNSIKEGFFNGVDKIFNFLTFKGWHTSEEYYYLRLEDEYNRFQRFPNTEGEFDIPLLVATGHYLKNVGPENFEYVDDKDNVHTEPSEDEENEEIEYFIEPKNTRAFYQVSANDLGRAYTLIPSERKLIGHLIDVKLSTQCVDFGHLIFGKDADLKEEEKKIIKNAWNSFADLILGVGADTIKSGFSRANVLNTARMIVDYSKMGRNYLDEGLYEKYATIDENLPFEIVRLLKEADFAVCPGLLNIPVPTFTLVVDYERYKEYLRDIHLEKVYFAFPNSPFYNKAEEEKAFIKEEMINDIFNLKGTWEELTGGFSMFDNVNPIYIPGLSSLPIPIAPGEKIRYTDKYGDRINPVTKKPQFHGGVDLAYPMGTPVMAIADGVVIEAGDGGTYGNYVKIKHDLDGDGVTDYYSLYAHLSVINTRVGLMVGGGQKIGEVGSTGRSTGPHLHFEIRDSNNKTMDPEPILGGIQRGDSIFDNTPISTYYDQNNFAHVPYCEGMNASIKTSGCLPTSYAMIAVRLGYKATPVTIANYICQNTTGYRIEGSGTLSGFLTDSSVATHFDINGFFIKGATIDTIVTILERGDPIIANVKGGHFNPSVGGHYLVIDSIDNDGKIKILDPGNSAKSKVPYTKEEIEKYLVNYLNTGIWYFKRR